MTASSDDTVQVVQHPPPPSTPTPAPAALPHPKAVKALLPLALSPLSEPYVLTAAGGTIHAWAHDAQAPSAPALLGALEAHAHDVSALRLWAREGARGAGGRLRSVEPWVVSAGLDGTVRRWRLSGAFGVLFFFLWVVGI